MESQNSGEVVEKEKAHGIQRVSYTHDAMIDLLIAKPTITGAEIGRHFGYTQGWVSRILGSDAFQQKLAARRSEIVNPELIRTFEERLQGLAVQSLEVIQNKLESTQNPDLAIKALDLSTRALGFGARPQNIGQQINQYVVALPTKIENEGEWASSAKQQVAEAKRNLDAPLVEDVTPKEKVS